MTRDEDKYARGARDLARAFAIESWVFALLGGVALIVWLFKWLFL